MDVSFSHSLLNVWLEKLGKLRKAEHLALSYSAYPRQDNTIFEAFQVTQYENGVLLRAQRAHDFVDLTIVALGYRANLKPRSRPGFPLKPYLKQLSTASVESLRFVCLLPPQLVMEQVFLNPPTTQELPADVRLSGASQIVIRPFKTQDNIPLHIKSLLDILQAGELQVDKRAASKCLNSWENQLMASFGDVNGPQSEEIWRDKLNNSMRPPPSTTSQLEVIPRLIMSPSEQTEWRPSEPHKMFGSERLSETQPIFSLSIDRAGQESMRFLWSKHLQVGTLPSPNGNFNSSKNFPIDQFDPMREIRYHWDIVGRTSVFGLLAIRPPESLNNTRTADGNVFNDVEIPNPRIVRPKMNDDRTLKIIELVESEVGLSGEIGVLQADPLKSCQLYLTCYGATHKTSWACRPPVIQPENLTQGFALQSFNSKYTTGHLNQLITVESGFLLPLGVPASFVSVARRNIAEGFSDDDGVSFIHTHNFIVCDNEWKSYPAVYQPYDGRGFPANRVQMLTSITPNLDRDNSHAKVHKKLATSEAFWVILDEKVAGKTGQPFVFSWRTNDASKVTSELVFLSYSTINDPNKLAMVKTGYNSSDTRRRTAQLGSVRHQYAQTEYTSCTSDQNFKPQKGSTSFDTLAWVMGLQGRVGLSAKEENFKIDGRMVAVNQVPLYPKLDSASIRLQTIAAISGENAGISEVEYYENYLVHGFNNIEITKNNGEIFLLVKDINSELKVSAQSNAVGGFAGPHINVGGLSRSNGLIGGKKSEQFTTSNPEFSIEEALNGNYNPKEFLPNGLILGIELNQLIENIVSTNFANAPVLRETAEYGLRSIFDVVQNIAQRLYDLLYGSGKVAAEVESLITKFKEQTGHSFDRYYPNLNQAWVPFKSANGDVGSALNEIIDAGHASEVSSDLNQLYEQINGLVRAIGRFLIDPIPDEIDRSLEEYREWLTILKGDLDGFYNIVASKVRQQSFDYLRDGFTHAIDELGYGEALFGVLGRQPSSIVFATPQRVLRALDYGILAYGTSSIWELLEGVFLCLEGISWPHDVDLARAEKYLKLGVERAVDRFDENLEAIRPGLASIRNPQDIERLFNAYRTALMGLFTRTGMPQNTSVTSDPVEVIRTYARRLDDLPSEINDQVNRSKLDFSEAIRVVNHQDPQSIINNIMVIIGAELDELAELLKSKIALTKEAIESALHSAERGAFSLGLWLAEQCAQKSLNLLGLKQIGKDPKQVCLKLSSYLKLLASDLLPSDADITNSVQDFKDKISEWDPKNSFEKKVRGRIIHVIDQSLLNILAELSNARSIIAQIDICQTPGIALSWLVSIAGIRGHLLDELLSIGDKLDDVANVQLSLNANFTKEFVEFSAIVGRLMTIVVAADVSPQHQEELRQSVSVMNILGLETDGLVEVLNRYEEQKTRVRAALSQLQPGQLRSFALQYIAAYKNILDKELTGVLMGPLAYGSVLLNDVTVSARKLTIAFLSSFTDGLNKIEVIFLSFDNVMKRTVLGGFLKTVLCNLNEARSTMKAEVETARELVAKLQQSNLTLSEVWHLIDTRLAYSYSNNNGGLQQAVNAISGIKLEDVLDDTIAQFFAPLRRLEELASLMVGQLVPSKFKTNYQSSFKLVARYPDIDPIFEIPNDRSKYSGELTLQGSFMIDPLTGEREARVEGTLSAFKINIVPSFPLCTVYFKESQFVSFNGESPKLTMDIASVDISPGLRFLDALKPYFGNSGNGPYIDLRLGEQAGVRAGVRYVAGLIQLGSLQILNVDFDVGADLPFSGGDASLFLKLSGPERPFLISSPPYAGGGWLMIDMSFKENSKQVISIGLVFGGQTTLKFGPLTAQAYAYVGIWYLQEPNNWRLTGLFEAGGHGKVAFFSISVFIRMTLTHENTGRVHGAVVMVFTFKVGFVKFRYRVVATQEFKKGKGNKHDLNLIGADLDGSKQTAVIHTRVPNKRTDWNNYRRHFAV